MMKRFVLAGLMIGLVACDAEVTDSTTQQGLTIFSATPADGLSGMYVEGDDVVLFETRRDASPENLAGQTASATEVAVRFIDGDGRFLGGLSQGHLPPEWEDDGAIADRQFDAQLASVETALRAIDAIVAADIDASMSPELEAFEMLVDNLSLSEASLRELTDAPVYYSSSSRQIVEVHVKCIDWFCFAQHGASRIWRQQNAGNGWVNVAGWDMCNHGTCPYGSGMRVKNVCSSPVVASDSQLVNAAVGCATGYNALSVSGYHNSNDDLDLQRSRVVSNHVLSQTGEGCADSGANSKPTTGCTCTDRWSGC